MKHLLVALVVMLCWIGCEEAPELEPDPIELINQNACKVPHVSDRFGDSSLIHVPNIFTPDGDGINDIFLAYLNTLDSIMSYELRVNDSSGINVFTTNDPDKRWEGRDLDGGLAESAIYDYVVEITTVIGTETFTGQVTLIRPSESSFFVSDDSLEIQNCADCVFPDQISLQNGAANPTNQELEDICE